MSEQSASNLFGVLSFQRATFYIDVYLLKG